MNPTLIGYFAKRTMIRPDWLNTAAVDEVCSVSTCVSKAADGWIDRWQHNDMWVCDTPELATGVVPQEERKEFDLYAYQMFPVVFNAGQQEHFEIPPVRVQMLPDSFQRLGYDIVSRSAGTA